MFSKLKKDFLDSLCGDGKGQKLSYKKAGVIRVICSEEQERGIRIGDCLAYDGGECEFPDCSDCCYYPDNIIFMRGNLVLSKEEADLKDGSLTESIKKHTFGYDSPFGEIGEALGKGSDGK